MRYHDNSHHGLGGGCRGPMGGLSQSSITRQLHIHCMIV